MSITFAPYVGPVTGGASLPFYRPNIAATRTGERAVALPFYRPVLTAQSLFPSITLPFYQPLLSVSTGAKVAALAFYRPVIEAFSFPPPVSRVALLPFYQPSISGSGPRGVKGSATNLPFYMPQLHANRTGERAVALAFYLPAVSGQQFFNAGAFFFCTQSAGFASVIAGSGVQLLLERLSLAGATAQQATHGLLDGLEFSDHTVFLRTLLERLSSGIDFADTLSLTYRILLTSGFSLAGTAKGALTLALQLVEMLRLTAGIGTSRSARMLVAEAIALHDVLTRVYKETLTQQMVFNQALSQARQARLTEMDSLVLTSHATYGATFSAIVSESFTLTDAIAGTRAVLMQLQDNLGLTLTVKLGDTVYYAWVVNTRNKAFTQYQNYPFNSFCEYPKGSGDYYGMAADGAYLLSGPSDNGTPILARIRMGLNNMGTGKMKRFPSIYLGYSSSGQVLLKVTTTSPQGAKNETWYELSPQTANAMREGRIKIGRGLKSVFWDFELTNVAGSTLNLNSMELFPVILDRRLGGSNG